MRSVWLIARWAPMLVGLGWFAVRDGAVWYVTACLAVAALARPRTFYLGLPAAGAAWYLGAPLWLALAAAFHRLLYVDPVEGLTSRFMTPPVRTLPLTPRLRCGHLGKGAAKPADTAMREGRPASALDHYLRMLADHPAACADPCVRVLLTRAAEAALRCACPQIAGDLAAGALHGLAAEPEGGLAVVAARAGALRAWALGELGDRPEAALASRRAQRVPHRDGPTGELVRTTALGVHFHDTRPGTTCDQEQNTAAGLLREQRLSAGSRRVLIAVHMIIGERLLGAGHPAEAVKAFSEAGISTGVHERTWGDDSAFQLWRHRIGPRWRGAVRLWLATLCEQMLSQIANGDQVIGALHEEYEHAVALAPSFEDPLLTARLTAYHLTLDPQSPGDGRPAIRHLMETRPFVFADRRAQDSWAALHAEDGTADGLAWWTRTADRARLLEAAREAEALFTRLVAVSPQVFGALHDRAVDTADTLRGLLDEPAPVRRRPRNPSSTAGAPEPPSTAARIAAVLAGPAGWTRPASVDSPGASGSPGSSGSPRSPGPEPSARSAGPVSVALPQGQLGEPDWLADAEALIGGRSWTVLTAVAEAQRLGHGRVGPEHLLLAVLDDPLCASLLEPFGVGRAAVREATAAVLGPDLGDPAVATPAARARDVLLDAGACARRHGDRTARPLHLLTALLGQETGTPVSLLVTLGADPREILARADLRLHADRAEAVGASVCRPHGLPDPRPYTDRARAVLVEAAREASSAGSTGLLGLPELSAALTTKGLTAPSPGGTAGPAVRMTHGARRALDLAVSRARGLGHPGVDPDDMEWAVAEAERAARAVSGPATDRPEGDGAALPGWDEAVVRALDTAAATAEADGHPYIAPEHLSAALAAEAHRPAPMVPLPLTPLGKRALSVARARAAALRRPVCGPDDLLHGLAAAGLRPMTDPVNPAADGGPDATTTPSLLSPEFGLSLRHALEAREEECERAAARADVRGLRQALWQRGELLRFLAVADPRTYEARSVEAMAATAHQLGAGQALDATLRQAASRARAVRARTPGPGGLLSYARVLVEMGTCLTRLDRPGPAAPCFAEAARTLRAGGHTDGEAEAEAAETAETEAETDSLLGVALFQYARCVRLTAPAAAVPPLMEAAGHYLTAAVDGGLPQGAELPEAVLFVIGALAELDDHEQALAVATRTLRVPGLSPRTLLEVHLRRAELLQELDAADLGVGDLTAAVLLAPDDPYPLTRRGALFMDLRRWEEALTDLDRASELAPRSPAPRRLRGQVLLRRGDVAEALVVLEDATANFPHPEPRGDVLWDLAAALHAMGRLPESLRVARAAYAQAPEFPWFRYRYALSLHLAGSVRHSRLHLGAAIRKETERLRGSPRSGTGTGRLAGNLTVYFAALGAERQSRTWLRASLTQLSHLSHPWALAELGEDLRELSRAIPTTSALCAELLATLHTETAGDAGTAGEAGGAAHVK